MNNRLSLEGFLIFAALVLGACSTTHQTVHLDPVLSTSAASWPKASGPIALRVRDERLTQELGVRGPATGSATITTNQDVAQLLRIKISDALAARGVQVVPFESSVQRNMTVNLQRLEYRVTGATVTINTVLDAALVNGTRELKKTYSAQREQRFVFTPVGKTNEEWINETLSDALSKLCSDDKMLAFLFE